ncbi:MAG: hypothetical protein ABI442_00410 [Gemmatimonadaceae bacterium]
MRRRFGLLVIRLAAPAVTFMVPGPSAAAQVAAARPDTQRAPGAMRALQLLQGFQMASSPELSSAINALLEDNGAHMRMAAKRPGTAADTARAREIVKTAREALAKYKDVSIAEKDGYVEFMPWLTDQSIFHFNSFANVFATMGPFDATKPVSLLYKKDENGAMKLVGAMYSAMPDATPAALDARLPTSIAHWHEHVDFCGPNPDSVRAGTQKIDGPSTARWLKISTREECATAGGRFVPRMFGWMAHVYLFSGDDMKTVWGGDEHSSMDMDPGMHHPPAPATKPPEVGRP